MTNYNDGYWHGWNGGECPVNPDTVVETVFQDGWIDKKSRAKEWLWDDDGYSIIAFRVVKEHREHREFWILEEGYVCTQKPSSSGWVHVREVIDNG